MKKTVQTLALACTTAILAGCGWLTGDDGLFRDRQDDYRQATLDAPLQIPEGLSSDAISDELAVPGTTAGAALSGSFVIPRPDPLSGAPGEEAVRIQKLGDERWILVESTPGEVWPRIRQFLASSQLAVDRIDPANGIIETGWLQPQGDLQRERYRFRVEQGVQRNATEVYVLQSQAGDGWPQQSAQPSREAEMTGALAQFIADSGDTGTVSMLAQRALDDRGRVFLERQPQQPPTLRLQLPLERGWASLEAALPKAGFEVADRNTSERQFAVRYAPALVRSGEPAEQRGWVGSLWHRLTGGDDEDEALADESGYLVTLQPLAEGEMRISINRQDGRSIEPQVAESLLVRIKNNLS